MENKKSVIFISEIILLSQKFLLTKHRNLYRAQDYIVYLKIRLLFAFLPLDNLSLALMRLASHEVHSVIYRQKLIQSHFGINI
jgi:hypothetical protein